MEDNYRSHVERINGFYPLCYAAQLLLETKTYCESLVSKTQYLKRSYDMFNWIRLLLAAAAAFGSGAKDISKKMCLKTATATVDEIELLKPIFYILFSIQAAFSHFFSYSVWAFAFVRAQLDVTDLETSQCHISISIYINDCEYALYGFNGRLAKLIHFHVVASLVHHIEQNI